MYINHLSSFLVYPLFSLGDPHHSLVDLFLNVEQRRSNYSILQTYLTFYIISIMSAELASSHDLLVSLQQQPLSIPLHKILPFRLSAHLYIYWGSILFYDSAPLNSSLSPKRTSSSNMISLPSHCKLTPEFPHYLHPNIYGSTLQPNWDNWSPHNILPDSSKILRTQNSVDKPFQMSI